jgi:hypothetical protein
MVARKVSAVLHHLAPGCLLVLAIAVAAIWIGFLGYAAFMLIERLIGMGLAIAGSLS